jgi:cell division protease FtsH
MSTVMKNLRRHARSLTRLPSWAVRRARREPRRAAAGIVLAALIVALVGTTLLAAPRASDTPASGEPTFTFRTGWTLVELQRHIEAGEVEAITAVQDDSGKPASLLARTTDGQVIPIVLAVDAGQAVAAFIALGYDDLLTTEAAGISRPTITGTAGPNLLAILLPVFVLVLTLGLVLRLSRRSGGAQRDTSNFKTILPPTAAEAADNETALDGLAPSVRLDDVAGCDEAKLELTETIEFLRTPERFHKLGARIPRGIMLYGPPGTGKTMLARGVASEAGVPFHHVSGSEFVEKYVGVGAKRVRDLFAHARKLGRGVIFFDEFDALAKARGGPNSHEEREQTLNQLLVELDGFGTTDDVVVIAATNRLDTLDAAVLRPGRFNRKIHVGLPDVKGRAEILAVHARNKPLSTSVDLGETARKTYGFSGAMLADLLNEAAILAARRGSEFIAGEDLHGGWLKVAVGTSRRRSMDQRERSIIAAHEVGHAICGRLHGDKRKVEEISLFAHGEALGVTVSSQEDNDLPSESDLRARLIALMGGRAAEEILFHEVTGGASNDFEAANKIATAMVTRWGMGRDPEALDHGITGRGTLSFLIPAPGSRSLPSDVQAAATRAIRAILDEAYAEASRTLVANMETLRRLAAYLVEHERLDGETFDELFEGRRHVPNAGEEWRAATARPRAWGDIVDLAAHRTRVPGVGLAGVAATAPISVDAPAMSEEATVTGELAATAISAASPEALDGEPGTDVVEHAPAPPPTRVVRVRRRTNTAGRRPPGPGAASRRLRFAAAGVLRRAEGWLRQSAAEGDRL